MKNDMNGISTTQNGHENYESFKHNGKTFIQYDYRTVDGRLFSCVAPTLDKCREKRDKWQNS